MNHPDAAAALHSVSPRALDLRYAARPSDAMQTVDPEQMTDQLLESEAAFLTLAEAVPQIVWVTGTDGGNT